MASEFLARGKISAAESIRSLITVISGLAITSPIVAFFDFSEDEYSPDLFDYVKLVIFVLLVVRFYHGNWRLIDDSYMLNNYSESLEYTEDRRNVMSLDFFSVVINCFLLAILGFNILDTNVFVISFIVLLFIDIFWIGISTRWREIEEIWRLRGPYYVYWFLNNFIFIVLIFNLYILYRNFDGNVIIYEYALFFLILSNSIISVFISKNDYFPKKENKT